MANVAAWMLYPPADDGRSAYLRQVASETMATTAAILFAAALLLSTRARWMEPFFGGLDKVYRAHRNAAVAGFLFLVSHVAVIPWRLDSPGGVPPGLIAFTGITVLVILSVAPRLAITRRLITLDYRSWRRTHWLIGFFFIFSLAHMLLVDSLVTTSAVPFVVVMAAYVIGVVSFLYGILLARLVRPTRKYEVTEAKRLNDTTLEVALTPRTKPISHTSGQFVFVKFRGRPLREPHPFTVASSPRDHLLRLAIRASGDFTRDLHARLRTGHRAKVEGAYGMLDYRTGRADQIWVAGGIGVTPFLSWLRDIDTLHNRVDFFYTVREREDALFIDDIERAARQHDRLRFHLTISSRDGSLTVDSILEQANSEPSAVSIYMCGPAGMVSSFESEFRTRGVHRNDIHYEEFSFR